MSKMSRYIYSICFCFIGIFVAIYPNDSLDAARAGLMLWFNSVLPALLPFFICVDIMTGLGILGFLGRLFKPVMKPLFNVPGEAAFAFIMSASSGYPVGASITANLQKSGKCTAVEAQRMLSFCSTSGPLFIMGAVAAGILRNAKLGLLLILAHYLSALTMGFLMKFYGKKEHMTKTVFRPSSTKNISKVKTREKQKSEMTIGSLMKDAVVGSVNLILMIGGFIILFSVIVRILKISGILGVLTKLICSALPFANIDPSVVSGILVGILEMTNGINECALLHIPLLYKIVLISFMMAFGGLSVNAQVLSVVVGTNLKFSLYMLLKVIQGLFAALYSFLMFDLVGYLHVFNLYETLQPGIAVLNSSWLRIFMYSCTNLLYVLGFVLMLGLLAKIEVLVTKRL